MNYLLAIYSALGHLVLGADGKPSASKLSYLVFVVTFTRHMWLTQPVDPLMWLVFGGLVGGVEVAKKWISAKYIGLPEQQQGVAS